MFYSKTHRSSAASLLRMLFIVLPLGLLLAGCNDSKKEKEQSRKAERPAKERVFVLKQRFDQLEANIAEMKRDLAIQQKRLESTQEIADSIKHSLTKGSLKGYSLSNISTTDPMVLKAITQEHARKAEKAGQTELKENAEERILNALLIIVFVVFIIIMFVVALRDRNAQNQPFEAEVMPDYPASGDPETEDSVAPFDSEDDASDAGDSLDDTGSYEYGELRPPLPRHDPGDPLDENRPGESPRDDGL